MKKPLLLPVVFLLAVIGGASGQSSSISLGFTAINNQQKVVLDSVFIENLTKGTDTVLINPDTALVLFVPEGISDEIPLIGDKTFVYPNYPNPFSDRTDFLVSVPNKEAVEISVADISGKTTAAYSNTLPAGIHSFTFFAGKENLYICSVKSGDNSTSMKMVSTGSENGVVCRIRYNGTSEKPESLKSYLSNGNFGFTTGDQLRFTGYAKTITMAKGSKVYEDTPSQTKTYTFDITEGVPCRDIPYFTYEGQLYNTVKIGNQCWMKENLNVGIKIWGGLDQQDNDTIEKYCFNNDPQICDVYGGLYQWNETMNYTESQQTRGICPEGWHIPSINEWEILGEFAGGSATAGEHLKEAGNAHWISFYYASVDNSTGFTALPGGQRRFSEYFDFLGEYGNFWSSTSTGYPYSLMEVLSYETPELYRFDEGTRHYGYSVRCILNINSIPVVITAPVSDISDTTAFSGGEVIDEGSSAVTARGVCWSTDEVPTLANAHTNDSIGPGNFTSYLQFLQPGEKYYYTAYATNQYGTNYGIIDDFTTLVITLPVVPMQGLSDITDSSVIAYAYIQNDGNGEIYERGFCWSTVSNPTIDDAHSHDSTTGNSFQYEITGLSPNTAYYVKAYARNKAGISYSYENPLVTRSGVDNAVPCPGIPTVTYEGQTYNTVQIGEQCWMKENLNVGIKVQENVNQSNNGIIEKYCYGDANSLCDTYGGLYQWNEVMNYDTAQGGQGICPDGWHIPKKSEWSALSAFLGGNSVSGGAMKETSTVHWVFPNTGATNVVGFTALPAGQRLPSQDFEWGWYVTLGTQTFLWTSTQGGWGPYVWNLYYQSAGSGYQYPEGATSGYSVRCVKD